MDSAHSVRDAALRAEDAANTSQVAAEEVKAAKAAGVNTSDSAGALESAIAAAKEEMSNAAVKAEVVTMAIKRLSGLLGTVPVTEDWESLYESPAGNTTGWHAICALEPLEGMKFMTESDPDPAACADVCVSAGDRCVGFNFQ